MASIADAKSLLFQWLERKLNKLYYIPNFIFKTIIEGIAEHKTIGLLFVAITISKEGKSININN